MQKKGTFKPALSQEHASPADLDHSRTSVLQKPQPAGLRTRTSLSLSIDFIAVLLRNQLAFVARSFCDNRYEWESQALAPATIKPETGGCAPTVPNKLDQSESRFAARVRTGERREEAWYPPEAIWITCAQEAEAA